MIDDEEGYILACQWCDATYEWDELGAWLAGAEPYTQWSRAPLPLVLVGDVVLEVVGRYDCCGAPMVRADMGKPFHLAVPSTAVEILRN